uniref:E3 ubiquitin-protein ligase n=1 Tax=Hirondellea gigas TaxID=1518452 RepID=A0A2P2HWE1_9CRUS
MWSSQPYSMPMEESVDDVVKRWHQLDEEGNLSARNFREYWKTAVPPIFAPQPNVNPLDTGEQDDQAQKLLLQPLHRFIAGSSSTPDHVYNKIAELDKAPSLCGRVFNSGEPTYGCRDCGFDPTCVLCSDCFKSSSHTKHRYKMSTSSGGGYCDCGDTEAWRSDAFCEVHAKGLAEAEQPTHKILDEELVNRIRLVMETIIEYAIQMMLQAEGISLPSDLELPDAEPTRNLKLYQMRDNFCAVLYNDESHTFDQVIDALERAVKCSKKEAVAFVTFIDREGRCVIKCSGLQQCQTVKENMVKRAHHLVSKPFIIKILRAHVQAHQAFSSHLLTWLDELLDKGNVIKSLFAENIFTVRRGSNLTTLEHIMWMDNELCKATRIQWHKLFITGLLMDLETKRKFARLFAKHYSKMMKTFIADDHEHSVCIVSLGVQLFTMPTIAHMLIAEESVIAKLLLTFIGECQTRIKNGKLCPLSQNSSMNNQEVNSMTPNEFKRVQFILFDLKYLLGMVPTTWTDQLRKGFLHGFSQIIQLFVHMQNMDSVTRKEGSHVEFEQEWEGAFNLHIKMSPIIPLLVDWAASDRIVLIKAVRMLQKALHEHGCSGIQKRFMREAAGHTVSCIEYDVAKSPVSMHIPLTRLFGALMVHLQKFDLNYDSSEFGVTGKPALKDLLEPALRTLVMIAQCKAGMWRRNGLSLTNQTYFYRNVRCRQEMLDRDVLLMQSAASLMDPNDFFITVLNRFGLMSWQRADYETTYMWGRDEDNVLQTVVILEEFLLLLLYILAERYTVGVAEVTVDDIINHEVIHLLCIQDMTHSTINKLLPEGTNHETGMEQIIDEIAEFKKISEDTKGFYQLRKKFYHMYNIFFYHYSKEDQSKSEVQHRERCKKLGEENVCCPPPPPPPYTPPFLPLLQLFNCQVFRHLLTQIVYRWCDGRSQSVTEMSVQICVHLIGVACHDEERTPGLLTNTEQLQTLLVELQSCQNSHPLLPLINWTINKLSSVVRVNESSSDVCNNSSAPNTSSKATAEPHSAPGSTMSEKEKKAGEARVRRKKIMEKMACMQKKFMKTQKNLFVEETEGSSTVGEESKTGGDPESPMEESGVDALTQENITVGPNQTLPRNLESQLTCIVCHQDETVGMRSKCPDTAADDDSDNVVMTDSGADTDRLLVVGVMVQSSTVLTRRRKEFKTGNQPLYLPADLHRGIHVSSCGHPMHVDCWKLYYTKMIQREQKRTFRIHQMLNFDIERSEYLCPLCESVCNDAVPLLPPPTEPLVTKTVPSDQPDLSPQDWLIGIHTVVAKKLLRPLKDAASMDSDNYDSLDSNTAEEAAVSGVWLPPSLSTVVSTLREENSSELADNFTQMFASRYNMARPTLLAGADLVMWDLAHSIFRHGLDKLQNPDDERILGSVLVSLAYTIRSMEEVQRFEGRALLTNVTERQHMFLAALTATAAYCPSLITQKQSATVPTSACVNVLADLLGAGSRTLLEMDMFSTMVSLVLLLPTLFSTTHATAKGSLQDQYVMELCLYCHILQLLLTYDTSIMADELMDTETEGDDTLSAPASESHTTADDDELLMPNCDSSREADALWLHQLFNYCRKTLGLKHVDVDPQKLLPYVMKNCLPYLRCCGLFFHLLTGCAAPEELRSSVWVPESEYYCLLRYLGLPTSLANSLQHFTSITKKWMTHPRLSKCLVKKTFDGHRVLKVNLLMPLTRDYSELISEVANLICASSTTGEKSNTPTICLVCGSIMCSQPYCCQSELPNSQQKMVGPTTMHSWNCCAGSGMFLRVWDCRVIFRTGKYRGCYYSPPYLDQYGETDLGLRRGNPLFLNNELYSRLHMMWLQHLIPESVSRIQLTQQNVINTGGWQYL